MRISNKVEHSAQPAPKWLLSAVASGLQRLMLLALPGTPAAETIEGTARAWTDAFWHCPKAWDKDLDTPRIAAAFRTIACRLERFPTPKIILDALPPRPRPPALPRPEITREQREKNLKRIKALIEEMAKAKKNRPKRRLRATRPALTEAEEQTLLTEAKQRYSGLKKSI